MALGYIRFFSSGVPAKSLSDFVGYLVSYGHAYSVNETRIETAYRSGGGPN